jgi:cell division protein FtsW
MGLALSVSKGIRLDTIQVVLNIAVVTNTIPNTGVILPFISYGGTSLVFLMAEMGLALSVSKGIRLDTIE